MQFNKKKEKKLEESNSNVIPLGVFLHKLWNNLYAFIEIEEYKIRIKILHTIMYIRV